MLQQVKYTEEIIGDFDFISFTKEFTQLNSIILYDLHVYVDIGSRIKKSSQAMEALKTFQGLRICGCRR